MRRVAGGFLLLGLGLTAFIAVFTALSVATRIVLSSRWQLSGSESVRLIVLNATVLVGVAGVTLLVLIWALQLRLQASYAGPTGSGTRSRYIAVFMGGVLPLLGLGAVLLGSGGHGRLIFHREWGVVSYRENNDLGIKCRPACPDSQTNNLGYRDDPIDPENRAGRARVVLLGDSMVFGYRLADAGRLDVQMERILQEHDPVRKWEVLNLGVEGFNYYSMVKTLAALGKKLRPEWVVFALGPTFRGDLDPLDPWMRIEREGEMLNFVSHVLLATGDLYRINDRRKQSWQARHAAPIPHEIRQDWEEAKRALRESQSALGFRLLFFSYRGPAPVLDELGGLVDAGILWPVPGWENMDGLSIPGDPARHPTAKANRMFAEAMVGAILSR